jgi:transposase
MALQHPRVDLTPPERRSLQRALRLEQQAGVALRATIVLWSAQGQSASSIARTLGVTSRMVYSCRRRWRLHGVAGLADAPRTGRPPRVTATYLKVLLETVDTDPRQLGFAFARWTCARLAAYLQQRTQVALSDWWVGELLRCHGYVWRRAKRTTQHLADEEEKSTRRSAPASAPEGGAAPGGGLRVVVRRRRPLRLVTGDALHVAPPGPTPAAAHSRQQRAGRSLWSHPLPLPAVPLHPSAPQRHHRPVSASAGATGGARKEQRAANRARPRQRLSLHLPPCPDRA